MLQAGFNNPWSVNLSTMETTTQVEPRAAVSFQSFEHFDVISIVDNGTDHKNCCRFVFYNNIASFWRPSTLKFLGKSRAREREKQIALS